MKPLKIQQSSKQNGSIPNLDWYTSLHQMEMFSRKCPEMDFSRFSAFHTANDASCSYFERGKNICSHTFVS